MLLAALIAFPLVLTAMRPGGPLWWLVALFAASFTGAVLLGLTESVATEVDRFQSRAPGPLSPDEVPDEADRPAPAPRK